MSENKRGNHLLLLKETQSINTQVELEAALSRFETGEFNVLPANSPLTRSNLSIEAGVTRDTPFARYRMGSDKIGELRYPKIVEKFNSLRSSQKRKKDKNNNEKKEIADLKFKVRTLQNLLSKSRNLVNAQDTELVKTKKELKLMNNNAERDARLYEEKLLKLTNELIDLRRNNIKLLPKQKY